MQSLHKIIFIFLVSLFSQQLIAGGGWPQPKGSGFFKLSEWWLTSDQHFTDAGKIDPNTTFGIYTTSLYGEYGFTDKITGILYFPFFSRNYFNNTLSGTTNEVLVPGEAINSIGDINIAVKYGLLSKGPIALSATLLFGIPSGNDNGGTAGNLQTGDGEFNQLLRLDLGTSFKLGKLNAYANIYAGYNNRSNGFSDEIHYGIEAGTSFLSGKLNTALRLFGISSTKNGDSKDVPNSTSIFANNSEYISFSPEVSYFLTDKWGVSASIGTALSGKIIFANPSYEIGVFVKF